MRRRYLTEKQLAVLEEVVRGGYDEEYIRNRYHLRRGTLRRWFNNKLFRSEFEKSLRVVQFRSTALLASYSQIAAVKLIELTSSKSGETSRKACLDIIGLSRDMFKSGVNSDEKEGEEERERDVKDKITPEKASRLLAILAEQ
ncbi:MAG: hypothetical protein ACYTE8_01585 [Planctomycetota bacterium]|jgi:hypothetical protein